MKNLLLNSFAFIFLFFISVEGKTQRITGYFPNYNYSSAYNTGMQYQKMTHLYYFSLNPYRTAANQSDGSLWYTPGHTADPYSWFNAANFSAVVTRARSVNPNIKISIVTGGNPGSDGDLNARLAYIASNAGRLNTFCNNICSFIKTNNLDGWDLDWEFPNTATLKNNHETMLAAMRLKIDSMKLADCKQYEITIAVGGGYTDRTTHTCWNPAHTDYCNAAVINSVDFVNIMTYDGDIGAAPCSFASHQHYNLMVKALGDWSADFPTWPKSKMQLGVGFYDNNGTTFVSGGNNSTYYNNATYWGTGGSGCPNMQSKIDYARTQGTAGIFIWELTQDNLCAGTVPTCYSLLDCIYQYMTSSWGTWPLPSNPCTMPVTLLEFKAKVIKETTIISWVAEETNIDYYVLQSSFDGINFSEVQIIKAQGSNNIYSYADPRAANYFRLKIVSLNGSDQYSGIIRLGEDNLLSVYPNPFNQNINLSVPQEEGSIRVKVLNASGNELINQEFEGSSSIIKLGEELPIGIYFLSITTSSDVKYFKIMKE